MSRITGLTDEELTTLNSLVSWLELRVEPGRNGLLNEYFNTLQEIVAAAQSFKVGDRVCLTPIYPGQVIDSKPTGWSITVLPPPPFYALQHADGSRLAVMEGEFEADSDLKSEGRTWIPL